MSMKMHAVVKLNNGNLQGELNCKYFEEPFKFSSFMSMIDMMETTFDAKGFPEKHMLPRTFGDSKPRIRKHEMDLNTLVKEYSLKHESGSAGESSIGAVGIGSGGAASDGAGAVGATSDGSGAVGATSDGSGAVGATSQTSAEKTCTFDILVKFRHNAEWQGSIHWIEKDVTKQFSSIVELIKLMDNALAE